MNSDNTTIMITGASRGIGRATALALAKEEVKLIITYLHDKTAAQETADKAQRAGAQTAKVLRLDVTSKESIESAVKLVKDDIGEIGVLINNAGLVTWKKFRHQTKEEILSQLRVNLEGLIMVTKAFLPITGEAIVNIASGAGMNAYADLSVYCATKWGVRGFTQSLALEEKDLLIYTVNPGMTATQMTDFKGDDPEQVGQIIADSLSGKIKVKSGGDLNIWEHL